jgi:sulfite reductase (NADPH) flavoprotein alpha-component
MSWFGIDAAHAGAAALVVALYAAMCGAILLRERRRLRGAQAQRLALARGGAQDGDARPTLVVYASQTGAAQRLAWQTAGALHGAGMALRVEALGALTPDDLNGCRAALFIVSTCGEGDAPDNAAGFVRRFMGDGGAALAGLRYGLLALGDREFARFCAFGRRVDEWLQAQGAQALFERIEVDGLQPDALHRWQHELGRVASVGQALTWTREAPSPWRLAARRHLNAGSTGGPVYHLELEPPADAGAAPAWESGDLVRVHLPGPAQRPREYSIASTADAGRVHLLVRLERRADGGPGLASGWLTQDAALGDEIALTLLPHANFRLGANADRPLVLVGNGTGIAGLRAHLAARAAAGQRRNWLVFGERQRAHDFHFGADVEAWQAAGVLERVDLAFSRDQAAKVYVQDKLRDAADAVRAWLADGAAIYVCGSLEGMATGVEGALVEIVGRAEVDRLIDLGRYRRDVY